MSSDTRSPAEIERDIERERAELANSLSALQDRFSVEGLARQFTDQVSRHGGDIGHSVGRSVKDNPVALALTGIGLAWMMFGDGYGRSNGRGNGHDRHDPLGHDRDVHRGTTGNWTSTTMAPGTTPGARAGADTRPSGATTDTGSAYARASRAGASLSERWDRMTGEADRYGRRARASARDMRERLHEGTEGLSEEARRRVVQAREAAWRAQSQIEDSVRQGWAGTRNFFEEQPMVVGALAMAVGAALGAALPRTRMEDEAVGSWSDEVFEEAERIYRDEREKAERVVKAASAEAKAAVREKKTQAGKGTSATGTTTGEAAKSTAGRVARAAKDEAKRQNLGKPSSH